MVLGPGLIIFPGSPLQHRRLQAATNQGPIVFARLCENSRNVLRLGSARTVQDCDFEYLSVRPETCMMDVEPDRECSGTVARAVEPRRHFDERQDVYTTGLRCVCRTGR
jgi:hypothetical protein